MQTKMIALEPAMNLLKAKYPLAAQAIEGSVEVLEVACDAIQGYRAEASSTGSFDPAACNPTVRQVQKIMQLTCGQVFDDCMVGLIAYSVGMFRTLAEIKNYIGRTKARFTPTGVTGEGVDAEGNPTTFVANFPVAPGQSILLQMEDWPYPFPVGCLIGTLAFSNNNTEENFAQVLLQAFSGPKDVAPTAGNPGVLWNDADVTYGSELRCGDGCKSVFLKSIDCGPSLIGMLSQLRLVITNSTTASANITKQQLQVKMGGLVDYCCDACAVGVKSGCSCKH